MIEVHWHLGPIPVNWYGLGWAAAFIVGAALVRRWASRASRPALGVVLAAQGYPGSPRTGDVVSGLDDRGESKVKVFHAGTAERGGRVISAGGRVACVCALGATVGEAQRSAYDRVSQVQFEGMVYRRDIGYRALARECARS